MAPTTPRSLEQIARELGLQPQQVSSAVVLLDDGNTIPFITRYRKEQTGNLDERQLLAIKERVQARRQLDERAETILRVIESQGKLTPELRMAIKNADSLKHLEDLYLPFRPKRKSRAETARQQGLGPLAKRIWNADAEIISLRAAAKEFLIPDAGLTDVNQVLQGAADILAEQISEAPAVRDACRKVARQTGFLEVSVTRQGKESGQEYRDYFDYREKLNAIPPHRTLAINRGDKAGMLRVKMTWDEDTARNRISHHYGFHEHRFQSFLFDCAGDALSRLLRPSLEREFRREQSEQAEKHAVGVFAKNLRSLLLGAPLQGTRLLAIDPGFRTGCKIAVLDETGHLIATDLIYVTGNDEKKLAMQTKLADLLREHDCNVIVIGNGTACRETEELVAGLIANEMPDVKYAIVNEAGASIYSTSQIAREEFPDCDATERGTISIGRRLQDPLSELVKIEPQHIGVGMYQHDVNPKLLIESLDQVVESCVNFVGVDLNTASSSLLKHVSGLNQLIARRIVEFREQQGPFRTRKQLLDVTGIGEATFTQAAGFLKIRDGEEPLDATWIHPESYEAARKIVERIGNDGAQQADAKPLAQELSIGLPTCKDILEALARPGRDPRGELPGPVFKREILKLEDLAEGMELTGTILNVVDFGAFVDIGLKDSGLVHISHLANRFVQNPQDIVTVGETVKVWVLNVDAERKRVGLSMIPPGMEREKLERKPHNKSVDQKKPATQQKGRDSRPPRGRQSRIQPPRKPAKPLPPDVAEGKQPMSGFDQLKQMWDDKEKD